MQGRKSPTASYRLAASAAGMNRARGDRSRRRSPLMTGVAWWQAPAIPSVPCLLHQPGMSLAWSCGCALAEVTLASLLPPVDVATAAAVPGR